MGKPRNTKTPSATTAADTYRGTTDKRLPCRPFPTPAMPGDLWKRWAEGDATGNDNDWRAGALATYGRTLLEEMMESVIRWGNVAEMLNIEGVGNIGEGDWLDELKAIDGAMLSLREIIIPAMAATGAAAPAATA